MDANTTTLEHEKETKNTHRYEEVTDGSPPIIGTIYLQKWLLGDGDVPEEIEVTVSGA